MDESGAVAPGDQPASARRQQLGLDVAEQRTLVFRTRHQDAGRGELAERERAEVEVLERYLPAAVSDQEIRDADRAAISGGAASVGAVMGKVMPQFKGRAEGGTINAIAREELARKA